MTIKANTQQSVTQAQHTVNDRDLTLTGRRDMSTAAPAGNGRG